MPESRPLTSSAPRFAQAVVDPVAHLSRDPVLGLEVRLPCPDRLERPGGGQREVALQRLARLGVMTGQGERRHKVHVHMRDIGIDRDRPASQVNRLVIQPKICPQRRSR